MYNVSVIMPVYNNENTLERAIESILNQTMYGFELILVNDGSTDASAEICERYAKKEPLLIEVIQQEHLGRGVALNKGLFNSSGEYIYFADVTATFDDRLLQANVKLAKEKKAELVVFGFRSYKKENPTEVEYHLPRMPLITSKENFRDHYRNFHHFFPYVLYNKMYKREYLLKHRLKFPHISYGEDAFFNLSIYRELNSVAFNRGVYTYRNNQEENEHNRYQERRFDIQLKLAEYLEVMIEDWGYEKEYIDLIGDEYFEAIYSELVNIRLEDSPFTNEQQLKRIDAILNDRSIKENMQKLNQLYAKDSYKNALFQKMKEGNSEELLSVMEQKNKPKRISTKLTNVIYKLFNKD